MAEAHEYLREQVARAESEAQEWAEIAKALRKLQGKIGNGGGKAVAPTVRSTSLQGLSAPAAAEAVLRDAGKPLHLKDIMARMEAREFQIKDRVKMYATLYTGMSRQKKRFQKLGKGRFKLAKQQPTSQQLKVE